jgi:drug/metabolite transporter (DMT)-like permease
MKFMRSSRLAVLLLFSVALIWGYNWVVMKHATAYAPSIPFVTVRLFIAATCLFAFGMLTRRVLRVGHPKSVLAIAFFNSVIAFMMMMLAVETGEAGKSAILTYTMPFFVILIAWPVLGERPGRLQWVATAIALVGIAFLIDPYREPGRAEFYALASGLAWGVGVVLIRRHQTLHPDDSLALGAWQNLIGAAVLALFCLPDGFSGWNWSPMLVFALFYNGVVISAASLVLWFWLLRNVNSGIASLGTLATPVCGLIASMIEFGERPNRLEWLGIVLVMIALAITGLAAHRGFSKTQ